MYSPRMPNININNPPINNIVETIEDHPIAVSGLIILLISITIMETKLAVAIKVPRMVAKRKGLIENEVNPFVKRCNNFLIV